MLSNGVNPWVFTFFVVAGLQLLLLSIFYIRTKKDSTLRNFGIGLLLTSIAFGFWAYVTGFRPTDLAFVVGIGVLFFIGALFYFFMSYLTALKGNARIIAIIFGLVAFVILVALRFIFNKSNPGFSSDGFFSFNTDQLVLYAYAVVLAFAVMPSAYVVAGKAKNEVFSLFIKFGYTTLVIGTAILITSSDNYLQVINGIGMVAALAILLLAHLSYKFNSK